MDPARIFRPIICVFLLLAAVAPATPAAPQVDELLLSLAREHAEVTTPAGRTFSGRLDGIREGRLFLTQARDGGEISYSFAPGEIQGLRLPGQDMEARALELWDRGAIGEARPLLEALGRQRSHYIRFLNTMQRRPLFLLIQACDRAGDALAAIGFARLAQPFARTDEEQRIVRDSLLRAHVALELAQEAGELARRWCREADPAGTSALGWKVLAGLALEAHDAERALWTALQPVTFSTHRATEDLDACYALAVTAARQLGANAEADLLLEEMQQRGLGWPPDLRWPEVGREPGENASVSARPAPPPATDSSEGSTSGAIPAFDDVRKLSAPLALPGRGP